MFDVVVKKEDGHHGLLRRPPAIGTPHLIKYVVTVCGCCVLFPALLLSLGARGTCGPMLRPEMDVTH